jgi:Kef-type K+ transport system membrane component KefB
MTEIWALAALWLGLALVATLVSIWLRVATALSEIVVGLGLIFAPFTLKTLLFVGAMLVLSFVLPWLTPRFFNRYGGRPSELEAKYLLLCLFGMGAFATWEDSVAVLPAYLMGMVLANCLVRLSRKECTPRCACPPA